MKQFANTYGDFIADATINFTPEQRQKIAIGLLLTLGFAHRKAAAIAVLETKVEKIDAFETIGKELWPSIYNKEVA